jgi:homoserine O-acetyltransferase
MLRSLLLVLAAAAAIAQPNSPTPRYPNQTEADWTVRDFTFHTGEKLPELRLHYITLGMPARDASGRVANAVLIMHGTGGTGRAFLGAQFAGVLFGKDQPLDAGRYFIILPDDVGHGHSSKPSDGLHAKFPHYDYDDMVKAEYALVHDGLRVNHLRLVMGTSMGAMHTWVWGETYPDFMDALMPLASAPVAIAGRNRMFRAMVIQAIRGDPDWHGGEYVKPPVNGLIAAQYALWMMTSSALQLHKIDPTPEKADAAVAALRERAIRTDANDMLYQFESSTDYNPQPNLGKIQAPLWAVNSADDVVNPPEVGILEREIQKVPHGRYILIPTSDETRGHGTHSRAIVWKDYLLDLLRQTEAVRVKLATTKGDFVIEVHPDWAPLGAARFEELVRARYFDDSRFFRMVPGYIAQFGIAGDPRVAAQWQSRTFADDPVRQSNLRGYAAFAMTGPNARCTQIYINLADNLRLDAQGFAPFGEVVEGMQVVDRLYSGYGETSGGGMRAGRQAPLFAQGNAYLDAHYPKLDKLLSATL